ncbi:hypothetical protein B9Z55_005999 [Caenorhabditis nigoni]|uniref:Uncharacterized protein n=1 Tax=Caenorhabditis nigoni TaxID=1611254 RepID=A0A2G5V379_9PELO|nr:hypothetical protein B9Z55_005999 [Caenorhabditis nigoni]
MSDSAFDRERAEIVTRLLKVTDQLAATHELWKEFEELWVKPTMTKKRVQGQNEAQFWVMAKIMEREIQFTHMIWELTSAQAHETEALKEVILRETLHDEMTSIDDQTCRFRKIVDELESISKGTQYSAKRNGIVFDSETIKEDDDVSYSPSHSPFDEERSQIESRKIPLMEKLEKVNTFCDHISPFLVEALNYSKITKEAESTILDTICQNAVESTEALVEVMEAFKKESKEMEEVDRKEKLCNEVS